MVRWEELSLKQFINQTQTLKTFLGQMNITFITSAKKTTTTKKNDKQIESLEFSDHRCAVSDLSRPSVTSCQEQNCCCFTCFIGPIVNQRFAFMFFFVPFSLPKPQYTITKWKYYNYYGYSTKEIEIDLEMFLEKFT